MIFNLYVIKDELSGYASPVTIQTEEQAKRYFRQMCEENKLIKDNPEDFSIWEVGTFDTDEGILIGHELKLIERAKSIK